MEGRDVVAPSREHRLSGCPLQSGNGLPGVTVIYITLYIYIYITVLIYIYIRVLDGQWSAGTGGAFPTFP